ncbi:ImmA/IrrE family metallo-endopeptidase [bacterium]|nr:ImmA/IrrE family metallo-endopeptidase [bacterium]
MAKRIEALVDSKLLVWARKDAGLTVEQAAKKVRVKPERLESWERGERLPTISQLRKLARACKRPLAVFFLPEAPKDFQPMRDFRRFPGEVPGTESPKLRLEIRRARDRREIALELYMEMEGQLPEFSAGASVSDDPEELAAEIRNLLGVSRKDQVEFRDDYQALHRWRSALERAGVLVFQARGVELSEMRGFSISEVPFPAVVLNINDSVRGRIFTMLHDFVHIMLRDGGLCDLGEADRPPEEQRVEVFCNRVAGAVLVPKHDLLQESTVMRKRKGAGWSDDEIFELARRYRVSGETLLRRLLICGRITRQFYQEKRKESEEEHRPQAQGGFAPPHRAAISTAGALFVRLVLNSYHQENITASDLSDFLDIKLKHVPEIEREVMGRLTEVGAVG